MFCEAVPLVLRFELRVGEKVVDGAADDSNDGAVLAMLESVIAG